MKILLITPHVWNDYVYSNALLTNWFTGFDAELAHIYTDSSLPNNSVCHKYYQIDERQMARSLFFGKKAGREVSIPRDNAELDATRVNTQRVGIYKFFKKLSLRMHTPVVMLQDLIWVTGRYDKKALKKFIDDFNPDIVFSPHLACPAMFRLERMVHNMTDAPLVAFTGDDEASFKMVCYSPLGWLRRWYIHNGLQKTSKIYSHYCMHSADQAEDYHRLYNLPTSTLYKCGDFPTEFTPKPVGTPIRMVYAGRLYCGRWETLAEIGRALQQINKDGERIVLDIYTQEELTAEQKEALCPEHSVYVRGSVTPAQLRDVYRQADIALHVESLRKKERLATRLSFSTKIIDLMASSCAIFAMCWENQCGFKYLQDHDAAFCVSTYNGILPMLQRIVDNPSLVQEYARKAYNCGVENHTRQKIQNQIRNLFEDVINCNSK